MIGSKFHHFGVAVSSIDSGRDMYATLFGYRVLSGPFDDPIQKVTVCFLGTGEPGEPVVEIVAPLGERSPVDQMLTKDIISYHICYEVEDIEQSLADARKRGCMIIAQPVPAVAFAGRRIAWLYTPNRQLVELVESGRRAEGTGTGEGS